jgi:hypothetical protein
MLKSCTGITIAILLFVHFSFGQQRDGSVLERRISIIQNNQPLYRILDQISWQAGIYFSYNASLLNASQNYTIEATDKSLFTVLSELFKNKNVKFTERENQIIISEKLENEKIVTSPADTIPVKFFFLSGRIVDEKKGNPIKYASVSVFNKPIGTISNTDGDFLLKIHPGNIMDTLIISCMGYSQLIIPAYAMLDEDIFEMSPISIRIREVKVTSTTPQKLLENIRNNLEKNYSSEIKLMRAFYRETIKQDGEYISVSEAVTEILKSPYVNTFRDDLVRLVKARRSPDVKPFYWLNFKLQGGPFTITKLDVIKTMESFLDEDFEQLYKYSISKVIWYKNQPVYVLKFQPTSDIVFPGFVGEMFVHRESYAVIHANFHFNRSGLRKATSTMIKKKPHGVKARPSYVNYTVNYQQYKGKWHLAGAQASVKFKIRSRRDKINSEFHSVSDILVTNIQSTELKRFARKESFSQRDIFVEMIDEYDAEFWENYNIIKPDESLENAIKTFSNN